MKKICALLMASLLLSAGTASAVGTTGVAASVLAPGKIIKADNAKSGTDYYELPAFAKLSTGVTLGYKTGLSTYAISTKHLNGDRAFGAAANDGKNYYIEANVGDSATQPTTSDSADFTTTGWSAL